MAVHRRCPAGHRKQDPAEVKGGFRGEERREAQTWWNGYERGGANHELGHR